MPKYKIKQTWQLSSLCEMPSLPLMRQPHHFNHLTYFLPLPYFYGDNIYALNAATAAIKTVQKHNIPRL